MYKFLTCLILLLFPLLLFSQALLKPHEKLIYSFQTTGKKTVLIALDTVKHKVIYRYGTITYTELEIIHDTGSGTCDVADTDKYRNTFSYNFYARWGGAENLGENDNYFEFINKDFFYSIYSEYAAVDGKTNIGIRVTNLKARGETDIKGILKTQKGNLEDFRFNKCVLITYGNR